MNIIELAFGMSAAVGRYAQRVRGFFYQVMLSGHFCSKCQGAIEMLEEGRARCTVCHSTLDPTLAFQRCSDCGGPPRLRIRRYVCRDCSQDIRSQFLFDGLVFDAEYFRQKMAEHRERRKQLRERVSAMLADTRSGAIAVEPIEGGEDAGLFAALGAMTLDAFSAAIPQLRDGFDLARYQTHIQAHLQTIPINLNQIPPLSENTRLDRVWRFVAVIFLTHAGLIDVRQEGDMILVMQREIDREGPTIPGDLEEPDGVEGPMGRAAAW